MNQRTEVCVASQGEHWSQSLRAYRAVGGINTARLIGYLLPEPWQQQCEIIEGWMPKFPREACPMCVAGTPPRRYAGGGDVHLDYGQPLEGAKSCIPGTRPKLVVRYGPPYDAEGGQWYLRHSLGPLQGHGWDIYGDDYQSVELGIVAISQAPPPPRGLPYYTFTIPLRAASAETEAVSADALPNAYESDPGVSRRGR